MSTDHPSDTQRGRACLYYNAHLLIIWRDDTPILKECLVTEISVKDERCFLKCFYSSPNQYPKQFQSFYDYLDILMNNINSFNPAILIITENFNKKCSKWYFFDASDNIGKESDTIGSIAGYGQIIDKSIHFTNSSSSCIDLNFTSNPSIIVDSGIEKTLSSSSHHDIMYGN